MNDKRMDDEKLLIDLSLGQCEPETAAAARRRLAEDEQFAKIHRNIENSLAALNLACEYEPPEGLVEATIDRVRQHRQTQALIERQRPAPRTFAGTFSLRELGALAAAAVLLAAVFVPSLLESRRRALIGQCAADLGHAGYALQAYATENEGRLPGVEREEPWLPAQGREAVSNSAGIFKLVSGGYASPTWFQCPAVGGDSFVVQAGMTDFPGPKYVSFSYQHSIGPERLRIDDPRLGDVQEHMAILADESPVFQGGRFHPEGVTAQASENHGGRGHNVLYLDRHVAWKQEASVGVEQDNIFLAGGIRHYEGTERPTDVTDSFLLPAYSSVGGR
jgi:hypothetical protein